MALEIAPEYQDVLPALTELFGEAARSGRTAEVEGKLGFLDTRANFDSGVPQQTYNKLLLLLESNAGWDAVRDWQDSQDYYFPDGVRGSKTADGDAYFERKVTVRHLNVRCPDRPLSLRISWKDESPITPPTALPQWVRIKTRKSFVHKAFTFDLTYVWSGRNEEEARAAAPSYEVEVECRHLDEPKGPEYLALSLLMKLHDLLGRDASCRFELV